jgi:membrane protein DedA with SNARE-associated domain
MQEFVIEWIRHYGYISIFSLLVLGIAGMPIPDEWLITFSGYLVFKHTLQFTPTVASTFLGAACGISVSYAAGRSFGVYLIEKYGHVIHVTKERVEAAGAWFDLLGRETLFVGYFIPGVRHLTAYLAGTSRMRLRVFALFAYSGAFLWSLGFILAGYYGGEEWSYLARSINYKVAAGAALIITGLAAFFALTGAQHRRP